MVATVLSTYRYYMHNIVILMSIMQFYWHSYPTSEKILPLNTDAMHYAQVRVRRPLAPSATNTRVCCFQFACYGPLPCPLAAAAAAALATMVISCFSTTSHHPATSSTAMSSHHELQSPRLADSFRPSFQPSRDLAVDEVRQKERDGENREASVQVIQPRGQVGARPRQNEQGQPRGFGADVDEQELAEKDPHRQVKGLLDGVLEIRPLPITADGRWPRPSTSSSSSSSVAVVAVDDLELLQWREVFASYDEAVPAAAAIIGCRRGCCGAVHSDILAAAG